MTYEYECDECGAQFKVEQRITAPKGAECPECGEHTEHRLIQPTAFLLKGGCWAKDGYGK